MKKVVVGMSGGVDSSVTAHLLKEEGFEVEGVSFVLYEARMKSSFAGCCSIETIKDAAITASQIGVSHTIVDLREEFMEKVIEPFIGAYSKGLTPNPCILCNRYIKFPYLLKVAEQKGASYISTGHYAQTDGAKLRKGIDAKKDQSYVLYVIGRECLGRLKLPLGAKRKDEVREIARSLNLAAAKRPESQEICFIDDRHYFKFLENVSDSREGGVIDIETGKTIGRHSGIHLYTIGQRKRLGVATGKPQYVVKIDPAQNLIFIGPKEAAMMREFGVEDMIWLDRREKDFRATVKVRSTMKDEPATVRMSGSGCVKVVFDAPQWSPAPGQSAVFYEDDAVVGGGVINGVGDGD
ncbi:MAG: tRNA 2-thiouridine(34) synthase MnmA [Nitrospirae bacterium]|nr:MAG: tRNA 2-thiouridine(34) synthase MnmA [Nitrospirota bacterium]